MRPREEAERLLKKSAEDEALLDQTLTNQSIADATWGFHAQQAVEKILKAVLASRATPYSKTHDLAALSELISSQGLVCPIGIDALDAFTPFAVSLRYDDDFDVELDRVEARALVAQLRTWAEKLVRV